MEENQDPEKHSGAKNGKQSLSTSILNHHGCYMSDGKRKIDFIMAYVLADHHSVAVVENVDTEKRRHYFLDNVLKEGLELESEEVHDSKEVILFIKVHVPFETLCKWAHILKMEMPLKIRDENRRHAVEERGSLYTWWQKTFHFYHCSTIGRENFEVLATDEKVYHPFDDKDLEKFDIGSDREQFFPDRFRQEIAWEALQQASNDPEDEKLRGIEALVEEKIFETAYPVHDAIHELLNQDGKAQNLRHKLSHEWANWRSLGYQQPLIRIRDYFGEKFIGDGELDFLKEEKDLKNS